MSGFSVVIPTLNEERHLGPLLSDVAAQTMSPDQVLVVDAGSDDATVTVAGRQALPRPLLFGPRGPSGRPRAHRTGGRGWVEWAMLGSNQRPLPCEGSALPLS